MPPLSQYLRVKVIVQVLLVALETLHSPAALRNLGQNAEDLAAAMLDFPESLFMQKGMRLLLSKMLA